MPVLRVLVCVLASDNEDLEDNVDSDAYETYEDLQANAWVPKFYDCPHKFKDKHICKVSTSEIC